MSCSVAVSNSPVFSPSSPLFCPSNDALNLTLTHLIPPSSYPSSPSPSPPFMLRLQKPPTGSLLSSSSSSSSSSSASVSTSPTACMGAGTVETVLKRKRPAKLDIPAGKTATSFAAPKTPCEVRREVESEGDGFSVYCKRGTKEAMEDRFSASVELQGDAKQVNFFTASLIQIMS